MEILALVLRFEAKIIISDRFYMAPFSALEQTHCAHVAGDSEWVTVAFYGTF